MKIWKLVAVVALAVAPAAFGAPQLLLTPSAAADADQKTTMAVEVGVPFTVNVNLVGMTVPVTQVSFSVMSDKPGNVRLTGRTVEGSILTDRTTADATLLGAANSLLSPKNAKDIGVTSFDGMTGVDGPATLETLTFVIEQPITLPTMLTIVGPGSFINGTWGDADFNSFDLPQTSLTLVPIPEPASMLLLAAGAAFFARRRRA